MSTNTQEIIEPLEHETCPDADSFKQPDVATSVTPAVSSSALIVGIAITALLFWSYRDALGMLWHRWMNEGDYSHGFFVPLFSIALLWLRRDKFPSKSGGGMWLGVVLILLAAGLRIGSHYYLYELLDPLTLIPMLAGVTLVLGGWGALLWAWPSIVFLFFMVPLPGFLAGSLSHELQRMGTIGSVYILQTVGVPAVSQGNIIWLTDGQIGVVEACSGLRMLNVFIAICLAAAFVIQRPVWERVLIVVSALPIGIAANILRISATGILYETAGAEWAERVFHDMAGLLMMPLAMALLGLELLILSKLLVPPPKTDLLAMNVNSSSSSDLDRREKRRRKKR